MLIYNLLTTNMPKSNHTKSLVFMFHKVVFLMDKLTDQTLKNTLNLTHSQFLILMALNHYPNVSQSKIAEFLELTQAAVSRQIDILKYKNMIFQKEKDTNRREHIVSLTNTGKKELEKAFHILDSKFQNKFQILNSNEKKSLTESLQKLFDTLSSRKKEVV